MQKSFVIDDSYNNEIEVDVNAHPCKGIKEVVQQPSNDGTEELDHKEKNETISNAYFNIIVAKNL